MIKYYRRYMSLKKMYQQDTTGIEHGKCYIFPKIDGCFPYSHKVMLSDGTTEMIGKIVNQKLEVEVLSYDFETGKVVPRKVKNWFKYATNEKEVKEEWIVIGVERNGTQLTSIANSRMKIKTTPNHKIFIKEGEEIIEKRADELIEGDIVYVPSLNPSAIQKQIILGTLLGDGSAFPNSNSAYNGITFSHGKKQKDFVEYKSSLLGDLMKIKCGERIVKGSSPGSFSEEDNIRYYGSSICDRRTQYLYDIAYKDGKKTVSLDWLNELSSLGLAIWYMDDGSLHKNIKSEIATLHVEGFSDEEQEIINNYLNNRGYDSRIQKAGSYNIIKLGVEGSDRFFTDISQHIIPSLQYKLPTRFKNRYTPIIDDVDTSIGIQPRKIISIEVGVNAVSTDFSNGFQKFDIEVEGLHNYFCNGIMVHNSNGSLWSDNGVLMCGSRNRVLNETKDGDNSGFCKLMRQDERYLRFFEKYPDLRLYGEFLVPHSLRTYREDAWKKFYVFDVIRETNCETETDDFQYLTYEEYQPLLDEFGLDYLAPLCIIDCPTKEQLIHAMNNNIFLLQDGAGVGEGIVVKNYSFVNKYGRVVWAKWVTSEFKEKHYKEMGAPVIHNDTIVEKQMVEAAVTRTLVVKEYFKIVQLEGTWERKMIPRLLGVVFHCLVTEELWDLLKAFKNPMVDFKLLNSICLAKTKEIFPEMFQDGVADFKED